MRVFRTDDNRRRRRQHRLACVRSVVKILTVIVITVTLTLSCIRLGQAIVTTSTVSHTKTNDGSIDHDYGKLLTTTVSNTVDVIASNVPEDLLALRLREDVNTAADAISNIRTPATDQRRFDSKEHTRPTKTDLIRYYDRFRTGSLVFGSRSPRFYNRNNVMKEIHRRIDDSNSSKIINTNIGSDINVNMGSTVYRPNERSNKRQFNNNNNFNIQKDVKKELTYNQDVDDHKHNEDLTDGTGWTTIYGLGQIFSDGSSSGNLDDTGYLSRPPFGLGAHNPSSQHNDFRADPQPGPDGVITIPGQPLNTYISPTYGLYHGTQQIPEPRPDTVPTQSPNTTPSRPPIMTPAQPPSTITARPLSVTPESVSTSISPPQIVITIPTIRKFDWQKIGILILFKLGLLRIKAIGFLTFLFLILFKLKGLLAAIMFKFFLLFNLLIIFKVLLPPLFIVPLLPILASIVSPVFITGLLSIPRWIISVILGLTNKDAVSVTTTLPNILNNDHSEGFYGPSSSSSYSFNPGIGINIPGSTIPISGETANIPISPKLQRFFGQSIMVNKITSDDEDYESDDFNSFSERRYDSLGQFDTIFDLFRMVSDSDKCVKRIACHMAVAEKVGILPSLVNWLVYRIVKLIPNNQLILYLETYDDVNNKIRTISTTPDNWARWCLQHYDC